MIYTVIIFSVIEIQEWIFEKNMRKRSVVFFHAFVGHQIWMYMLYVSYILRTCIQNYKDFILEKKPFNLHYT